MENSGALLKPLRISSLNTPFELNITLYFEVIFRHGL